MSCARVLARKYIRWLVGALVGIGGGCGDDVAALAESPAEPTIWASGEAFAGDIVFAQGVRVGARVVSPAQVEPGSAVTVKCTRYGRHSVPPVSAAS